MIQDDNNEDDDDMEDEERDDGGYLYFNDSEIPAGFEFIEKPANFLSEKEQQPTYVPLCFDDDCSIVTSQLWWIGKIVKYKPRARVYNYDIQWSYTSPCQQRLNLEDYVDDDETPTVAAGRWCCLKRTTAQPGRSSDRPSDDDEASRPSHRRRIVACLEDGYAAVVASSSSSVFFALRTSRSAKEDRRLPIWPWMHPHKPKNSLYAFRCNSDRFQQIWKIRKVIWVT